MANQDDDLFAQAMKKVRPLFRNQNLKPVVSTKKTAKSTPQAVSIPQKQVKSPVIMPSPMEADESWVLRANGVSPETLKKLTNGQPSIHQTIDLHGMTRDQALQTLESCLQHVLASGGRVICVIHGRGLHSHDRKPILKHAIYDWFRCGSMSGHILAVIPMPKGGGGSCLVLLRRDKCK